MVTPYVTFYKQRHTYLQKLLSEFLTLFGAGDKVPGRLAQSSVGRTYETVESEESEGPPSKHKDVQWQTQHKDSNTGNIT
jgi:hypothetical protein